MDDITSDGYLADLDLIYPFASDAQGDDSGFQTVHPVAENELLGHGSVSSNRLIPISTGRPDETKNSEGTTSAYKFEDAVEDHREKIVRKDNFMEGIGEPEKIYSLRDVTVGKENLATPICQNSEDITVNGASQKDSKDASKSGLDVSADDHADKSGTESRPFYPKLEDWLVQSCATGKEILPNVKETELPQQKRISLRVKWPLPDFSDTTFLCLTRPPSHLLPPNVRPNKEVYPIHPLTCSGRDRSLEKFRRARETNNNNKYSSPTVKTLDKVYSRSELSQPKTFVGNSTSCLGKNTGSGHVRNQSDKDSVGSFKNKQLASYGKEVELCSVINNGHTTKFTASTSHVSPDCLGAINPLQSRARNWSTYERGTTNESDCSQRKYNEMAAAVSTRATEQSHAWNWSTY